MVRFCCIIEQCHGPHLISDGSRHTKHTLCLLFLEAGGEIWVLNRYLLLVLSKRPPLHAHPAWEVAKVQQEEGACTLQHLYSTEDAPSAQALNKGLATSCSLVFSLYYMLEYLYKQAVTDLNGIMDPLRMFMLDNLS